MLNLNKSLLFSLTLAAAALPAQAKSAPGSMLQAVRVDSVAMFRQGDEMNILYSFDLSGLRPASNERVVLTPVLTAEMPAPEPGAEAVPATLEANWLQLPPVVVNGRNAQIKYEREASQRVLGAAAVLQPKKGSQSNWDGAATVPYEPWMDYCSLSLREDLCGCGDLLSQTSLPVGEAFDNRPAPAAVMVFLQPKVEAEKARAEEGSAFVDYVVNKTNILPDYRNNRAEIRKITSTIDLVKNDPLVTITEINIHGYASPEGSWANNARLAEGRAASLKNYVRSLYTLPERLFTSASTPEDWAGLRRMVEGSTLADRAEILAVIDSGLEPDAKDAALRTQFPASYSYMLANFYPALRHSDYKVKYTVRPLTVEETAEVIRTNPKNASVQEMFLVAQTYDPGSDEFNEAMAVAVRTYPDDPTANLNAGIAALNASDLEIAARCLAKADPAVPETQLAQGVLIMQQAMQLPASQWQQRIAALDAAQPYLESAAAAGIEEASDALRILGRNRQLASQNR